MYNIGDIVFDTEIGANVHITKNELWEYTSYTVLDSSTCRVYKTNEEQLNKIAKSIRYYENYLRYVMFLSKNRMKSREVFCSVRRNYFLSHQLHVPNRAMETNNIRYILVNEVGLGENHRTQDDC